MKKQLIAAAVSVATVVSLASGTVSAWTYGLTGQGVCEPDGSFKITWKIDNSTENETLTVRQSSNAAIVPVGSTVGAGDQKNFHQTVDGTAPGTYTLTLKANWPSDMDEQTQSATVRLADPCDQPTPPQQPPATGGQGGGAPVTPVSTPSVTPAAQPQVVAPAGAVNAGSNGVDRVNTGALAGLLVSISVLAICARRLLTKQL